ncbi:phospholipid/cholesterol/gamma-HCH transport system substrate-binding protein [Altererythrobacter atlanticus]|uniref:Paraquat-inducible protein B n=1 Tax=Croceibacterium atlanticum TaxID=1267766 RepID=A0A0F7KSD2_9SPHN|nr:MlaD family protein [Croceibacterium atlanticum]AKH42474.1 paraquat-inducible protein B [Croceibacterium atlanticum]MBB5731251.1 phospholipid/cholesterol/gamma-HCH transport system substrate-binding protein [Croceibacterium atlanticum]
METRANHVWVGLVTLLLLAALAAFFVWLAGLGSRDLKEYDIFFEQSVGGLANGSEVTFQGVPAGQVTQIELWKKDPEFVRVRVALRKEIPILQGTTASISASFTGVSNVSLGGAVRGAPPINEPGPEGVPVIPATPGAIGEILASAPLLLERLATLTDRLSRLLSDDNQQSISGILANTDRITAQLAETSPQVEATLKELQGTLAQSTETLAAFEDTLHSTDNLLNKEGESLAGELRKTLQSARLAADALQGTLEDARPAARSLAESTLPAADATLRDLRRTSEALREITEKIENEGAGAVVGGTKLPDYEP